MICFENEAEAESFYGKDWEKMKTTQGCVIFSRRGVCVDPAQFYGDPAQ